MEHPAFSDAGAGPGVEIWTIDKFEPVAIEEKLYGKFYNGDSYIVLKTTGDDTSTLSYDAHFWLGAQTTQDKKGSAAILTVTLDDMLGGRAVHHREVQGHESSQFLGYFQPAIRYLEGGNESGFNQVETNAGAEKRLLKLTGSDNLRIEEVPAEASSLTKDNCFILEVDHDIFVLMPEGAKATQRRKIISVANTLRDDYHNGRATIEIIDEFSSDEDFALFFEALGSGCKDDLVDDDSSDAYTRDSISEVYLYKVLVGDELEVVALSKPFKQKHLASDEVYILDTPCSGVYIWLGKDVDVDTRKNYNDIAQKYLDIKGYPSWLHVTRVSEGSESSTFKQYFHSWDSILGASFFTTETDAGYFSSDADEAAASAYLIGKSAAARGYMPDHGDGSLAVTRIAGDQEDISDQIQAGLSILYQTEVYVVKYQYTAESGDDAYVIYLWLGAEASDDDKKAGIQLAGEIEDELDGNATVVSVPQGKEPKHFLAVFKGDLAILFGGKDHDYKAVNSRGSYEDDSIRLFRVEGTELDVDMRAVQVPESADVLEDDDVFVLETPSVVYVRNGKNLRDEFSSDEDFALFFEALGSGCKDDLVDDDSSDAYTRDSISEVYLYKVLVGDELEVVALSKPFKQKHLASDEVYILDTPCSGVYIWLGKDVDVDTRKNYNDIAQKYLDIKGYPSWLHVTRVSEGSESSTFKQYFHSWDSILGASFFTTETDAGYFSSDADEAAASAYLIGKSAAARGYMPDHGDGSLAVTRIAGDQEDISDQIQAGLSILYQTEVYVVKYQYTAESGDDAYVIYLWLGAEASDDDKKAGIQLAGEIEDELDGNATVVSVPQGKEPKHFLAVFKGDLAILFGGKDHDYKAVNSRGSYEDDSIRLFRVEGTELDVDMRAVQVPESADVLEDDDVFVLETPSVVYVRNGKESDAKEQEVALKFVKKVVGDEKEISVVDQGEEPQEFWDALGGESEEREDASGWRKTVSRRMITPPSLTAVTVTIAGKIKYQELSPNFTQQDLSDDGVYILDVGEELYMWEGKSIPERVKQARIRIVQEYIEDDGLERTADTTLVVGVKQAREPSVFKKYFRDWDDEMWENQTSYEDMKNETKAANSK